MMMIIPVPETATKFDTCVFILLYKR